MERKKIKIALRRFDSNDDNFIDYNEFMDWMEYTDDYYEEIDRKLHPEDYVYEEEVCDIKLPKVIGYWHSIVVIFDD